MMSGSNTQRIQVPFKFAATVASEVELRIRPEHAFTEIYYWKVVINHYFEY